MITRGFVQNTVITRGYGFVLAGILKEMAHLTSGLYKVVSLWSKIWN